MREAIKARGTKGYITLVSLFNNMDVDKNKTLSFEEFRKAVIFIQLDLDFDGTKLLFDEFDIDKNGVISLDEFITGVRGNMSKQRKDLVLKAFKKFDRDGKGVIDINDLRNTFHAKNHPLVISKKKTEKEILQEFLLTFETHHKDRYNYFNNVRENFDASKPESEEGFKFGYRYYPAQEIIKSSNAVPAGVTEDDFVDYYQNVSATIDDDIFFTDLINRSWGLNKTFDVS